MIVDVDKDNGLATVSHCSGSGEGICITTISTKTGLVTNDETGCNVDRTGKKYFTKFVSIDYDKK